MISPVFTLSEPGDDAPSTGWPDGAVLVEAGFVFTDIEQLRAATAVRDVVVDMLRAGHDFSGLEAAEAPPRDNFDVACAEGVGKRIGARWLPFLMAACTDRSRAGIEAVAGRILADEEGEARADAVRVLSDAVLGVCREAANADPFDVEGFTATLKTRAREVGADGALDAYADGSTRWRPTVISGTVLDFGWLASLTRKVWQTSARAALRRERNSRPALTVAVTTDVLRDVTMNPQAELPLGDEEGSIRDARGRVVATYDHDDRDLINRHLSAFRTVTGHRLLRGVVHRAHDQLDEGSTDHRLIAFEGGYRGMAEALGCTSKKDPTTLKALLAVGSRLRFDSPSLGKFDGLWTVHERPARRGRSGAVSIIAGEMLAPNATGLVRGRNGKEKALARRLVPELRSEPPTGAVRPADQAAVWALHRLLLLEMVTKRRELHAQGSIRILDERWQRLAREAGLPLRSLDRVLDQWAEGESEQAPQLVERDGDRFTLASPHAAELAFIREGARIQVNAEHRSRKGKRKRGRKP